MAGGVCFITVASAPVVRRMCSKAGVSGAQVVTIEQVAPDLDRQVAKDIGNMGRTHVVITRDNEPATSTLAGWVKGGGHRGISGTQASAQSARGKVCADGEGV